MIPDGTPMISRILSSANARTSWSSRLEAVARAISAIASACSRLRETWPGAPAAIANGRQHSRVIALLDQRQARPVGCDELRGRSDDQVLEFLDVQALACGTAHLGEAAHPIGARRRLLGPAAVLD